MMELCVVKIWERPGWVQMLFIHALDIPHVPAHVGCSAVWLSSGTWSHPPPRPCIISVHRIEGPCCKDTTQSGTWALPGPILKGLRIPMLIHALWPGAKSCFSLPGTVLVLVLKVPHPGIPSFLGKPGLLVTPPRTCHFP